MSSFSRIQLENWLKQIDVKGSVIDIGGAQNPIKGRTKSWDISDYKILDLEFPHETKVNPDIITDINLKGKNEYLAYIAGLVDGEGSISVSKKTDSNFVSPQFSITMTDYNGIKVITDIFGYEFKLIKKSDGKDYWNLQLSGDKLKLFLSIIYPYLRVKHKQALLALELRDDIDLKRKKFLLKPEGYRFNGSEKQNDDTTNKRLRIYETIKTLNKYGSSFDNVFALEIMEYAFDPITALETMAYFLKPNGLLYISFHFIYPQHNPRELDYLRYTPTGVNKLLREVNFEILEHLPRTTQVADLRETWASEQMRGWKDMDNTIIGSLITARKL